MAPKKPQRFTTVSEIPQGLRYRPAGKRSPSHKTDTSLETHPANPQGGGYLGPDGQEGYKEDPRRSPCKQHPSQSGQDDGVARSKATSSSGLFSASEGCGASDAGLHLLGSEAASSSCIEGIPKQLFVKELAPRVHQPKSRYRALALLTAYFDESGIHENSPVTVIGGFLAPSEIWEKIEAEWQEKLDYFRVPYFHMAALEDGFEPLDKLRRELRYALYNNLISILLSHKPVPIASAVVNDDWNNFDRSSSQAKLTFARYPEPYDYCFDHISQFLITHSEQNYGGEPIALVFAEQTEYQSRALFVYNAFKKHPYWADRFISLTFAPMKRFPALQSADIMANDTYHKMAAFLDTKKPPAIEGLVKQFFDNGMQPYASYTDAAGLKAVVAQGPKWIVSLP